MKKRAKVKFLFNILGEEVYFAVDLRKRLKRLKLCFEQSEDKFDFRYEEAL